MKNLSWIVLGLLTIKSLSSANAYVYDAKYFQISQIKIQQISEKNVVLEEKVFQEDALKSLPGPDRKMNLPDIGKVIAVGKELVALGEDVYKLLDKGRPVVQTDHAPISVLPKIGDKTVDVFELENWSMPKTKKFKITYKNGFGSTVVRFDYLVIATTGGTYNGKGAYLTGVQIIPSNIHVSFGFDLSAVMKLQSLSNQGTKLSPIAGAVMVLKYRVGNMLGMNESNDTVFVNGNGVIQTY